MWVVRLTATRDLNNWMKNKENYSLTFFTTNETRCQPNAVDESNHSKCTGIVCRIQSSKLLYNPRRVLALLTTESSDTFTTPPAN